MEPYQVLLCLYRNVFVIIRRMLYARQEQFSDPRSQIHELMGHVYNLWRNSLLGYFIYLSHSVFIFSVIGITPPFAS